jgi:hypothetical protein
MGIAMVVSHWAIAPAKRRLAVLHHKQKGEVPRCAGEPHPSRVCGRLGPSEGLVWRAERQRRPVGHRRGPGRGPGQHGLNVEVDVLVSRVW